MKNNINIPNFTQADINRFWSKVLKDDNDNCWTWKNTLDKDGYGKFRNGKQFRAHRISYYLFYNIDPKNNLVLHSCDNPSCVNPHHLFIGNHQDNRIDCVSKGRANTPCGEKHFMNSKPELRTVGEKNGKSKLNAKQVIKIRELESKGVRQADIAKKFKVHHQYISLIVRGKRWKYLLPKEVIIPKINYAFGYINA